LRHLRFFAPDALPGVSPAKIKVIKTAGQTLMDASTRHLRRQKVK